MTVIKSLEIEPQILVGSSRQLSFLAHCVNWVSDCVGILL
jgi:hypothetical protein